VGALRNGAAAAVHLSARVLPIIVLVWSLAALGPISEARSLDDHDAASARTAVHESTLRWVVKSRCRVLLCLVGIEQKPISEDLLKKLEPLGRVAQVSEDDFVFENGAVRGFARRHGRIVNVEKVTFLREAQAQVEVGFLSTGLGTNSCIYRLRQSSTGGWEVDGKATRCSIS
jgi:hypothetical protein